jgi:hypothetical protein
MNMAHVGYADIHITSSGTQRSAMQTDDDKLQITTTAGILKVYNLSHYIIHGNRRWL